MAIVRYFLIASIIVGLSIFANQAVLAKNATINIVNNSSQSPLKISVLYDDEAQGNFYGPNGELAPGYGFDIQPSSTARMTLTHSGGAAYGKFSIFDATGGCSYSVAVNYDSQYFKSANLRIAITNLVPSPSCTGISVSKYDMAGTITYIHKP